MCPSKSLDRGVLSSWDDLIRRGKAGEFSTIQEKGDPVLQVGVRATFSTVQSFLGFQSSISPLALPQASKGRVVVGVKVRALMAAGT